MLFKELLKKRDKLQDLRNDFEKVKDLLFYYQGAHLESEVDEWSEKVSEEANTTQEFQFMIKDVCEVIDIVLGQMNDYINSAQVEEPPFMKGVKTHAKNEVKNSGTHT